MVVDGKGKIFEDRIKKNIEVEQERRSEKTSKKQEKTK